jgi:hypothetical protein
MTSPGAFGLVRGASVATMRSRDTRVTIVRGRFGQAEEGWRNDDVSTDNQHEVDAERGTWTCGEDGDAGSDDARGHR